MVALIIFFIIIHYILANTFIFVGRGNKFNITVYMETKECGMIINEKPLYWRQNGVEVCNYRTS